MALPVPDLLHPGIFDQPLYPATIEAANTIIDRIAVDPAPVVPGISVVIRSCFDDISQLTALREDTQTQKFHYGGEVQFIGVDCGNSTASSRALRRLMDEVVEVDRGPDFMPQSIRAGVERAAFPTVATLVGHSMLLSAMHFKEAAIVGASKTIDAAYGIVLPSRDSLLSERAGARFLGAKDKLSDEIVTSPQMGLMAADCSVFNREDFLNLYDHTGLKETVSQFGAGGADGRFGELLIYTGKTVARRAGLSVHHTHGLKPLASARQALAWSAMGDAQPYDEAKMTWHPHRGL